MADEPKKMDLASLLQDERVQQAMRDASGFIGGQYKDAGRDVAGALGGLIGKKPHDHEHHTHEHDHGNHSHDHSHDHSHGAHHHHGTGQSYAALTAASGLLAAGVTAAEHAPIPMPMKMLMSFASSIPMLNGILRPQVTHAIEERRPDEMARHGLTSALVGGGLLTQNHEWAASGAMMGWLNAVAGEMEGKFHGQQAAAIQDMRNQIPEMVMRVGRDGQLDEVPLSGILEGDEIFVPQGGFIPVDGTIVKGESQINTKFYTGQDEPEAMSVHDRVYQGGTTIDGGLTVRVDHKPEQSMISTLLDSVEQSPGSSHQTRIGNVVDKYTYLLLGATALQFGASLVKGQKAGQGLHFGKAMEDSLELAIKASPCTMMAAPLIFPFITKRLASEHGVFVNNQRGLENTRDIDTVLTDMTGTLTQGKPHVVGMFTADSSGNEIDPDDLLASVAAAERGSLHPLAGAIVGEAKAQGLTTHAELDDFAEAAGKGVSCTLDGKELIIGRESWIEENLGANEYIPDSVLEYAEEEREKGRSVVFSRHGDSWGVIALDDPIRENARETIQDLQARGINVAIITGDHAGRANRIAAELGIDKVYHDLKPEDKSTLVQEYKARGNRVAMVGDGLNDSLAMQVAQGEKEGEKEGVAFAIRGTAPLTESTSSIAIEDISQIPGLMDVSKRVDTIAKRNGTVAAGYTALLAGSHLFGVKLGPIAASLLHEAPSVGMIALSSKEAEALSGNLVDKHRQPSTPHDVTAPSTPAPVAPPTSNGGKGPQR